MQAAILRVKLPYLDRWNAMRQQHAARYTELLRDSGVEPPRLVTDGSHVYYVYVVRTHDREALRARLAGQDIQTGIHFPVPIHLQPAASGLGYVEGGLPHTEQAAGEVLSLPMYPELTDEQIVRVAEAVHSARPAHAQGRVRL
jgi:dTDP-4-amino-4,6-dideoxygalactose transaminase